MILETPVAITAGEVYVASYNTVNTGGAYYYVATNNLFNGATTTSGALSAFNTNVNPNGLFRVGAGLFPTNTFSGTAYFADVVFVEDVNETDPPEVIETNIAHGQTEVSPYTDLIIRFNEILATSSVQGATITLTADGGGPVPIDITYDTGRYEVTIEPQSSLVGETTYTLTIERANGITDFAGNLLQSDHIISFTTAIGENCPCSIWDVATFPMSNLQNGGTPLELGTKFESKIDGFITAVRFYKSPDSKGGEVGRLWTEGGVELASTTLVEAVGNAGEPGWYEARFATPVAIDADTTYVVSYSAANSDGVYRYSATPAYFVGNAVTRGPITAYATETKSNGVFATVTGVFPTLTSNGGSYFADIVFTDDLNESHLPIIVETSPQEGETGVSIHKTLRITFNEAFASSSIAGASITLADADGAEVSKAVSYDGGAYELLIDPSEVLRGNTTYTLTVERAGGFTDIAGNLLASDLVLTFTTEAVHSPGAGGPLLVLYDETDGFSHYYAEILRAEGFTSFSQLEISDLSSSAISSYATIVLGSLDLSAGQVTILSDWVTAGGNLILMRPETDLHDLAGVTVGGTLSEGYLLIASTTPEGAGLVHETIQFHGVADRYTVASGDTLASLYVDATTSAGEPAVLLRSVGEAGGQVATFSFDLAKSIIYSRQGNPANVGLDVNGDGVPRPNDLFHPDYVDLDKVAIPQADELQRLFAHLILTMSENKSPIPRFWYLPHMHKVAIMMTIDDHSPSTGRTETYFNDSLASSTPGCSLADWECYRATVWTYINNNAISDAEAASYHADGFEFGVHVRGPEPCAFNSIATYRGTYAQQLFGFRQFYPSLPSQLTHRYHCIVWSDWTDQVEVMYDNGIRLDLNYYYWPDTWVLNRPGYFTGSGFPMRYANIDGVAHNVYQAPTQLVNENGLTYPEKAQEMIDLALGDEGYYGILGTHGDTRGDGFEDYMLDLAVANDIPLVTAQQVLEWTDARNESVYGSMDFSNGVLSFTLDVAPNASGLMVMLPTEVNGETLLDVRKDGSTFTHSTSTIKGVEYVVFSGTDGDFEVEYTYTAAPPSAPSSHGSMLLNPQSLQERSSPDERSSTVSERDQATSTSEQQVSAQSILQRLLEGSLSLGNALNALTMGTVLAPSGTAEISCPDISRDLIRGMSGEDVRDLQRFLNVWELYRVAQTGPGSPGLETAFFGPRTEDAVKRYQTDHAQSILAPLGLMLATGVVGPATRAHIVSTCTM